MALCTLLQPMCLHATGRKRHSKLWTAGSVKRGNHDAGKQLHSHCDGGEVQVWTPATSMRRKHATAARCTASFFVACTACSASVWMTASFASGVSAFARMLKLLRRPRTRAASHDLRRSMLAASDGSCGR
jgi:hypothetical protein